LLRFGGIDRASRLLRGAGLCKGHRYRNTPGKALGMAGRKAGSMAQSARSNDLQGRLVVVVGGSGFVGRHLAQELLARGARLRVASRNPQRAFAVKPLGNLGQVQFARCDMMRPETLAPVVAGADAVVSLAGAFGGDLDAVQGRGVGALAAAAKAAGASAYAHVSAIGADAASEVAYARTKGEGEAAVRAAFPGASIVRPSLVFGPDDNFIQMFARLIAMAPALPVFGPEARLQPLFVDDLAAAIGNALAAPGTHGGKTFELGGPEVVTMRQLHDRIAAAQGRNTWLIDLPDAASGLFAAVTGWLPGAPITSDQWALLKAGSVADPRVPGLKALGVTGKPLGLFLDRWMVQYRKHGRFGTKASAR
jgi:uncharacterized protein YbjT (DUF2867 family)